MLHELLGQLRQPAAPSGLEVRFHPADYVYLYENNGEGTPRDLYTLLLHNIALVNTGAQPVTLQAALIAVEQDGAVIQAQLIDAATLQASAQKLYAYKAQGVLDFYDFQFQTSRYLRDINLSEMLTLVPQSAVVVTGRALLLQTVPERVTVLAQGQTADRQTISARGQLAVRQHDSSNDYHFPLKGRWLVDAASLNGHHRWAIIQEFALDAIQLGADGLSHRGDGTKLSQYYAYGAPVYAAADGAVVAVEGSHPEADSNLRQPGESAQEYMLRVAAAQQQLLAQGFEQVGGNYVIIQHANDEYSYYLHLRQNSVLVKAGDTVWRGQQIAALGHSGNSTEPHLHFHLADGPDMAYSRSIPVRFSNITLWPADDGGVRHLQAGQIIIAEG